jgi:hypothetical protein
MTEKQGMPMIDRAGRRLPDLGLLALILMIVLSGCTPGEAVETLSASFRAWCRNAAECSYHEERP